MKKIMSAIIFIALVFVILYFVQKEEVNKIPEVVKPKQVIINVNDRDLTVELEDNSSAEEFYKKLKDNHIVINAEDYGEFEKVGDLGFEIETNDKYITTKPGDLILYEGDKISLYYDTNSWRLTKLGKVINMDVMELKDFLGDGAVQMTFSRK